MIDKNNLRLGLIEDLTDMVLTAKFGTDCYYTETNGDSRLIPEAEDYYLLKSENIEDLIAKYEKDIETLQR